MQAGSKRSVGLQDVPIQEGEDSLGIGRYADALASFISKCDTPMTISIQGDWGAGKTSLMKLIQASLRQTVFPVWFNTWQYSQFESDNLLSISLIRRFTDEIAKGLPSGIADQAKAYAKTVSCVLSRIGSSIASGVINTATGASIDLQKAVQEGSDQPHDLLDTLTSLQSELAKVVAVRRSHEENKKIVVFVDDLDRLNPAKAVELMEAMKVFLDIEGCVFLVACDYEVIKRGITKKYGVRHSEESGKSFFDKIFQLSFIMPTGLYKVREYLEDLFQRVGFLSGDHGEHKAADMDKFTELLQYSVGFNPRNLKRLVNNLALINILQQAEHKSLEAVDAGELVRSRQILFGVGCMEHAYNHVYQEMLRRFGSDPSLNRLLMQELRDEETILRRGFFDGITEKDKRDKAAETLVKFISVFCALLNKDGDHILDTDELKGLREVMKTVSVTSVGQRDLPDEAAWVQVLSNFCHRVSDRVNELLGDMAPNKAHPKLRDPHQAKPWWGYWYHGQEEKRAWSRDHLAYFVRFDFVRHAEVSVGLFGYKDKIEKAGMARDRLEKCAEKLTSTLKDKGYKYRPIGKGGRGFELTKAVGTPFDSDKESPRIIEEEIEPVAQALADLVRGTGTLFDLPAKRRHPDAALVKPTINAKEFISDFRAGVNDADLMARHGLSGPGLKKVVEMLSARELLTQAEIDARSA